MGEWAVPAALLLAAALGLLGALLSRTFRTVDAAVRGVTEADPDPDVGR